MTSVGGAPAWGRTIVYWLTTAVMIFVMGSGGVADIIRIPAVSEGMSHLGYPTYFCVILGVWKVLAAVAFVIPRTPRLKEWAYAGTFFDLTGAAASHFSVGDPPLKLVAPLIFVLIAVASWALRPPSRRLAGPTL
ncbi:MAG TPA: DoxX family protein [Planctomycetaceae bacterium]|jgi:uncharacterized membrane protein YphA (DoxX/SURF4 family)|nr:DoxX family protein [Planctomycetaceae bacterium]